jgi:hypothetical protein
MASIYKETITGEYVFHWRIDTTGTEICAYAIYGFDGTHFYVKDNKEGVNKQDYQNAMSAYGYVEQAPIAPICGNGLNPDFWKDYFCKLSKSA